MVAGHYEGWHGIQHHHLLLVPADLKTDIFEQYEFDSRSGIGSSLFLSPDAGLVVIESGADIRVEDRQRHSSCSVSSSSDSEVLSLGGFITTELFLVTRRHPDSRDYPNEKARYELYGSDCSVRDAWELPGGGKASALREAGCLFIPRYFGGTRWETEFVEWPSWKPVKNWRFWQGGLAADNGRVLCSQSSGPGNSPVQCRDVASQALLARRVVVHDGDPLAVASSGSLAVGNDWFKMWKPFTEGEYWAHVKRQMLWDFRSAEVVASWVPRLQRDNAGKWKGVGFTIERVPFICALSHTGSFILEGGDETIRISRVSAR